MSPDPARTTTADRPRVATVPPGVAFLDALAAELLRRHGDDPLALSRVTVLLPTRRACRALQDAFLRLTGGRPLLLPAMRPLGDVDPAALEMEVDRLEGADGLAAGLDLPPEIPELRRRLLLARMILARRDLEVTPAQAAWLAADLARLLDRVQTERLGFDRLAELVPDDLAEHWQVTVEFLRIVSEHWPAVLAEEGALDPADRRDRLLSARAAAWRARPPDGPVIAAGVTGTNPATTELLTAVARLPQGEVVLPGLDRVLDGAAWAALDDTHPQFGLARLLEAIGLDRADVADWPLPPGDGPRPDRRRLIAEVMRPAATSEVWRGGPHGLDARALDGLVRIDCPTPHEEAGAIALRMRQALEEDGATVALVTPDRTLARRVAAALGRWGLAVDDSAGRPLAETPVGGFLRLAAACALSEAAPVELLALLKHPLASGGQDTATFRARARALERAVLRGPRPAPGFEGLRAALADVPRDRFEAAGERAVLGQWLDRLASLAEPFFSLTAARGRPLTALVEAHALFCEALAASDAEPGPARLWRREDGEAAAAFLSELYRAAGDMPPLAGRDYPPVLEALMAGRAVRPRYGGHSRLFVWGPLEARLQQPDVVVLGGLNEGTWPPDSQADPWMSRPMEKRFGLPPPERRIGLAAHDVAQLLAAPRVVLTRAERVGGAPSVPSRWLQRLDAVLDGAGLAGALASGGAYLDWLRQLDAPERVRPAAPPAPCPPVAARPRALSVTEIGKWMADPYAIYARRVLGLKPLDPLDADPGAAERGQIVHAALHRFIEGCLDGMPDDALDQLLGCGRAAFAPWFAYPGIAAFWWPRFERIAAWFVDRERERRAKAAPLAVERAGGCVLAGPEGDFRLRARADRIDRLADGRLAVIDYKTGTVPSDRMIAAGFAPQLPLEAAIASVGGFQGVDALEIGELVHWKLSGGDPAGELRPIKPEEMHDRIAEAWDGLLGLIARFDDPATPYLSQPRPAHARGDDDYAHLARVLEWSAGAGEAE